MKKVLLLCLLFSPLCGQELIVLNDSHLVAPAERRAALALIDEQVRLFDARSPEPQAPQSFYHAPYQKIYLPHEIYFKLPGFFHLEELRFYDAAGKDSLKIYLGEPGNWRLAAKAYTDRYRQWRSIKLNQPSEMLKIEVYSSQAEIGEILLYGRYLKKARHQQAFGEPASSHRKNFGDFLGVNAFVDDPLDKVAQVAKNIREYHSWQWNAGNKNEHYYPSDGLAFAPSAVSSWDFDRYYREAQARGVKVVPCVQKSPPWLNTEHPDHKPAQGAAEEVTSYTAYAAYLYQYAARYGGKKVPLRQLNLAPNQKPLSGLGLIEGLEVWNEPDKWWRGREGYFRAEEYAAFLSACYDGHRGALGPGVGIKQADPHLPVVMGGLAQLNLDYLEIIRLWSIYQREGDFPAEVLNFHHYSNDAGGQEGVPKRGVSPEKDALKTRMQSLIQYRDSHLKDQAIWLSEYGYDSNPRSPQGVPGEMNDYTAEQMQALWLLRASLLLWSSGLEQAHIYMFRDVNAPNPNKYNSSGLTQEKWNGHAPKESYKLLRDWQEAMGRAEFVALQERRPLKVMQLEVMLEGQRAFILWSKEDGRSVELKKGSLLLPAGRYKQKIRLTEGGWATKIYQSEAPLKISPEPILLITSEKE